MKTTTAFALVGNCVGMITPYHLPPLSVAIIYVPGMFLSPLKPSDSPAGCDLAYSMRVAVEFDFIAKKPPPGKYFPFLSLEQYMQKTEKTMRIGGSAFSTSIQKEIN